MDDNNQPANDVNTPADTQTAGDSSSDTQQTPVVSTTDTNDSGVTEPAPQQGHQDAVPYERFKEMNESFKQTQAELKAIREQQGQIAQRLEPQQPTEVVAAKEQLKSLIKEMAPELGFISQADVERKEAVREVDTEHTRLEQKYNGKDGLPKYDKQAVLDYALQLGFTNAKGLEIAYKQMHDAEIMNARIQSALTKTRGVQTETSNGTGSANTGVSNDDLKKAAQEGDPNAVHLILKRRLAGK